MLGKILDVYLPNEYKDNKLLDIMDRTKIGFKIKTKDEVLEIILDNNDNNSKIMKDDFVIIRKQIISNKEFIDLNITDETRKKTKPQHVRNEFRKVLRLSDSGIVDDISNKQLKITDKIKAFFRKNKECILVNQYGPTETHVVTSYTLNKNIEKLIGVLNE